MDQSPPKKSQMYTRTGDKGTTGLYNGQRVPKDDISIGALGDVDELNSFVGLAHAQVSVEYKLDQVSTAVSLRKWLAEIQSRLLDVGSAIATPKENSSEELVARNAFSHEHVDKLEAWIAVMEPQLPTLKNFILPSGGEASARLHVCRTVCRRAERSVIPLVNKGFLDAEVMIYLNRLSSFFFVAARWIAHATGGSEVVWKAHKVVQSETK